MMRRASSALLCAALLLSSWPASAARGARRVPAKPPISAPTPAPALKLPVLPQPGLVSGAAVPAASVVAAPGKDAAVPAAAGEAAAKSAAAAASAAPVAPVKAGLERGVSALGTARSRGDAAGERAELDRVYAEAGERRGGADDAVSAEFVPGDSARLSLSRPRRAAAAVKVLAAGLVAAAPWAALTDIPAQLNVEPIAWLGVSAAVIGAWGGRTLWRGWEAALRPSGRRLPGAGGAAAIAGVIGFGAAALLLGFWSIPAAAAGATAAAAVFAAQTGLLRLPAWPSAQRPLAAFARGARSETLMSVRPEQLGRLMTLSATLERGLGEKDLYTRRADGFDRLVYLRRAGDFVELVARNTKFRAAPGSRLERAVREAVPDSVLSKARVRREDPWTGAAQVDADDLFGGDLFDLSPDLGYLYEGRYELDEESSEVTDAKAYPSNAELRSRLVYKRVEASAEYSPQTHLADARRLELLMRYSLAVLPEGSGFIARSADERIGVFETEHQDLSDETRPDIDRNVANRWNLEKQDPSAAASPVKKPVVYWLDPSVPARYRPAVKRVVSEWNKAFARVGLLGAVELREAPADGSFDASDARYNVISFYLERDSGFAIGPSRVNPLTGQIYNASIAVSLYHVRHALGLSFTDLDETDLDDLDKPAPGRKERKPRHAHHAGCRHAQGAGREAAMTLDVLAARGGLSEQEKERFVEDYLVDLLLHEMGHTLGLRHNFLAKAWVPTAKLSEAHPIAASVMDYIPVNLAAPGQKQGHYWNTEIGPYDYLAIEYLYKPLDGSPVEKEAALKAIAARMDEQGLFYATDEDLTGIDPTSRTWVLGDDVLGFVSGRMAVIWELWESLEARRAVGGDGRDLYRAWVNGWKAYYRMARAAASFVGGVRFRRRAAAGGASYEPVSAAEQRRALELLNERVFSDAPLSISPELAAAMAPARLSTVNRAYPELAYVPYDDLTLVLRQGALDHLLDPETLERLSESARLARKDAAPLSLDELFDRLSASIWTEAFKPFRSTTRVKTRAISQSRRKLQEAHLHRLMELAFPADGEEMPHITFAARAHLKQLQGALKRASVGKGWDEASRAHLKQTVLHLVRAFKDYTP